MISTPKIQKKSLHENHVLLRLKTFIKFTTNFGGRIQFFFLPGDNLNTLQNGHMFTNRYRNMPKKNI